jgi:hypothetical protein
MSSELNRQPKPTLHIVPQEHCTPSDVRCHFSTLIAALSELHMQDAEMRQLWLETQWLKSDFEQNVLSMPANWELTIMQIARGHASPTMRNYPEVVQAATALGTAIKEHLRKQVRD